ncbi:MAG: sel1 repeat family protein [Planctomycetales bacterium]|nr:sel1 repeat family protein [Planctomycetales bacterium]
MAYSKHQNNTRTLTNLFVGCLVATLSISHSTVAIADAISDRHVAQMRVLQLDAKPVIELVRELSDQHLATWKDEADAGIASAQYIYALCCFNGIGVPEDKRKYIELMLHSAQQGFAPAEREIGSQYRRGDIIEKDVVEGTRWLEKAAEHGEFRTQNRLAYLYKDGRDVKQDERRAFELMRASAEAGYLWSENTLGWWLWQGICCESDPPEARQWFQKAADRGYAVAQSNLAAMMVEGAGGVRDVPNAVRYYQLAALQGDVAGQFNYALALDRGEGILQNFAEARIWYEKAAAQGHAIAQRMLAEILLIKLKDPTQFPQAIALLRKSIEQDDTWAKYQLGVCYFEGRGVPKSLDSSIRYMTAAATDGLAEAQYALAQTYRVGYSEACEKDASKAAPAVARQWMKKSAEQKYLLAMNNFGCMLKDGIGGPQDISLAVEYYQQAIDGGASISAYNLGMMHLLGDGIPEDSTKAFQLISKSADAGFVEAIFKLGLMYYCGKGVEGDAEKARELFVKASSQGHEGATKLMAEIRLQDFLSFIGTSSGRGLKEERGIYQQSPGTLNRPELWEMDGPSGHAEMLYRLNENARDNAVSGIDN